MKVYKLTDENGCTKNNTKWGENVTHVATGNPSQWLCSDAFIHAYEHPLLAVLHAPAHGECKDYTRLWECEGHGYIERECQMKCGFRSLTTLKEIEIPKVTSEQHIAYGILCALEVYEDDDFKRWGKAWLSGEDRSKESATLAAEVAKREAARAAAWAAAWAAWSACAEEWSEEWSAERAAARAAEDATYACESLDLITLAEKAMEVE